MANSFDSLMKRTQEIHNEPTSEQELEEVNARIEELENNAAVDMSEADWKEYYELLEIRNMIETGE